MANKERAPQTQIEALAAHYAELFTLGDIADETATRLNKLAPGIEENPAAARPFTPAEGDAMSTAMRLQELLHECTEHRNRVLGFMSLLEPETAADTLIMAVMAATLMNVGNESEGPDAEQDLKLAEEFAWKVIRGIERTASLPVNSLGLGFLLEHSTARPFGVRVDEARELHKRVAQS